MIWRQVRIVASGFCFALCVAFAFAWFRSHVAHMTINAYQGSPKYFLLNDEGEIHVAWWHSNKGWHPHFPDTHKSNPLQYHRWVQFPGFGLWSYDEGWSVIFHHWLLVLITGSLTVVFRPRPRLRFGIRDLLIVTTTVALVMSGFVVWLRTPLGW